MHNRNENLNFSSTCLIPVSNICKRNEYRLISSQLIFFKKKACYNLRELSPAQISWLHDVRGYFVSYYEQLFSHQKLIKQELSWNTYFSLLNPEYSINSHKYAQDQWYRWSRLTGHNINNSADINDSNNNNNVNNDGDIMNDINNEDIEIGNNRDWLDNFYILSRIFILFSIVYFYSSPTRFLVVTFLGFLVYLYHNRLLRVIPIAQNLNNNVNQNEERQQNRNPANSGPQGNRNQVLNEGIHQRILNPVNENNQEWPRTLTFIWTFFSSFFTSLIPDQPNVV